MTDAPAHPVLRHIRRLVGAGDSGPHGDGDLLARFAAQRDEAAFAALVERYGRLVWGVCRRVLGHEQDAEDAFQAAFLVLARKAGSLRHGAALPGWIHRVAYHTALRARARAARRQQHERGAAMPEH